MAACLEVRVGDLRPAHPSPIGIRMAACGQGLPRHSHDRPRKHMPLTSRGPIRQARSMVETVSSALRSARPCSAA